MGSKGQHCDIVTVGLRFCEDDLDIFGLLLVHLLGHYFFG